MSAASRRILELKEQFKTGNITRREYLAAIKAENLTPYEIQRATADASKGIVNPYYVSPSGAIASQIGSQAVEAQKQQQEVVQEPDIVTQKIEENRQRLMVEQQAPSLAPGQLSYAIKPLSSSISRDQAFQAYVRRQSPEIALLAEKSGKKQIIIATMENSSSKDYGAISTGFETRIKDLVASEKAAINFGERRKAMFGLSGVSDTYKSLLSNPTKWVRSTVIDFGTSAKIIGGRVGFAAEAITNKPGRAYLKEELVKGAYIKQAIKSYDITKPSGLLNLGLTVGMVQSIAKSPNNLGLKAYKGYRNIISEYKFSKAYSSIFEKSPYYEQRFSVEGIDKAGQRNLYGVKVPEKVLSEARIAMNKYKLTENIEINSLRPTTENVILSSGQKKLSTDIIRAFDAEGLEYPVRVAQGKEVFIFDKTGGGWTDISALKGKVTLRTETIKIGQTTTNIPSIRATPEYGVKVTSRQTYLDNFDPGFLKYRSELFMRESINLDNVKVYIKKSEPIIEKIVPIESTVASSTGLKVTSINLAKLNEISLGQISKPNYIEMTEYISPKTDILKGFSGMKLSPNIAQTFQPISISRLSVSSKGLYAQSSVSMFKPLSESMSLNKPITESLPSLKPGIRTFVFQAQKPIQIQIPKQQQSTMLSNMMPSFSTISLRNTFKGYQGTKPTEPQEPIIPPFDFKLTSFSPVESSKASGVQSLTKYRPSLEALFFNVRNKIPKVITPFSIRPIKVR